MIPNAGVVQSIDANFINLDGCWLWSTADIWSQDYAEVLAQPISLAANDLSELRFQVAVTTLTIRRGTQTNAPFVWSGVVTTVADPGGGGGGSGSVTSVGLSAPSNFEVTVSPITNTGVLTFEWAGTNMDIVLNDGSLLPRDTYVLATDFAGTGFVRSVDGEISVSPLVSADLPASGVTPGTYGSSTQVPVIVVDAKGRLVDVTLVNISGGGGGSTAWVDITGTPTTLAGYGITDAAPAFTSAAANLIFATPDGVPGVPVLRALVVADIPALPYEPQIAAGTAAQYWRGDKTWQTFPTIPTTLPPSGAASGDLSGTYPAPTVAKVNGLALPVSKTIVGTNASGQLVDASTATLANNTSGNAATATKWAAARTVAITGDVTWSVSLDGSTDVTAAGTLANSGVAAGTYGSATQVPVIVVDAKGRVTGVTLVTITGGGGTPAWADITGKPTTLSGYGITDATLQNAYLASAAPQITTTTAKGAVTLRRGSTADTDYVFVVENGSGSDQFLVTGNGDVTARRLVLTKDSPTYTDPASLELASNTPRIRLFDISSGGANQQGWEITCAGTYLSWDSLTDAGDVAGVMLAATKAPDGRLASVAIGGAGGLNGGLRIDNDTGICEVVTGYKTLNGTNSGFLKADGSVDETNYLADGTTAAARTFYAAPAGAAGDASFRTVVPTDIGTGTPTIDTWLRGDGAWQPLPVVASEDFPVGTPEPGQLEWFVVSSGAPDASLAPYVSLTDTGRVWAGSYTGSVFTDSTDDRLKIAANSAYVGQHWRITSYGSWTVHVEFSAYFEVFIGPLGAYSGVEYYTTVAADNTARAKFTSGACGYRTVVDIICLSLGTTGEFQVTARTDFTQELYLDAGASSVSHNTIIVDTTIDRWINLTPNGDGTSKYNCLEIIPVVA